MAKMEPLAIVELWAAEEALTRTTAKRYVSAGKTSANTARKMSKVSLCE